MSQRSFLPEFLGSPDGPAALSAPPDTHPIIAAIGELAEELLQADDTSPVGGEVPAFVRQGLQAMLPIVMRLMSNAPPAELAAGLRWFSSKLEAIAALDDTAPVEVEGGAAADIA